MFQVNQIVELMFPANPRPRVCTICAEGQDTLTLACEEEDVHRLAPGNEVRLTQVLGNNVYQMCARILECQGRHFTVPKDQPQLIERRLSRRIACDLEAFYRHDLLIPLKVRENQAETGKARILDLSMGGALLYAEQLLPIDVKFELYFCLDGEATIQVSAETLTCMPLKANRKACFSNLYYEVAVKFADLSRVAQVQIQRYLLDHTSKA